MLIFTNHYFIIFLEPHVVYSYIYIYIYRFDEPISNGFIKILLDIFVLCRLYRESISHFLLRRLISTKKYSLSPELNFECFLAMFVCSVWLCTFLTAANYFRRLYTTFGSYILLLMAIYYFCRLYTNFGGYIVLSVAIYYFQSYMLLSTLYTYFSFI